MYTLTAILNKDKNAVLLCEHQKLNIMNFIGGKVEPMEEYMDASYRELEEETGITKDDVELKFLQTEVFTLADGTTWSLYITYGVLKRDVTLIPEKNPLLWLTDFEKLRHYGFDGSLAVYMNRIQKVLNN